MVSGGAAVQLLVVAGTVVGLWVGARLLVDAAVRLARGAGLSDLVIGLTVVALGTSTPELVVSVDAATKGLGDIAVANVLGSNIYNLAFILGVIALLRMIPITETLVRRDGMALLVATALGGLTLLDLTVSRVEGLALMAALGSYTGILLRRGGDGPDDVDAPSDADATSPPPATSRLAGRFSFRGRTIVALVVGLALVVGSGDLLVGAASSLARGVGISEWVIGGTIVAAGTSTPEFAVSLVALRRGSLGVSVGNIVGSNVVNLLGIMGLAAAISPLTVSPTSLSTLAWLGAVTLLLVAALWTGRVLSRQEGALFALSELGRWGLGLFGAL